MEESYIADLKKAGLIHREVKAYARTIVKKGVPLLEIAEKIEAKLAQLGAKTAFPVNLSINDIAAHYTPSHDDKTLASGLLKVDIGISVNGAIADSAFSVDLEDDDDNKRLIAASREALEAAMKTAKFGVTLGTVGRAIQNAIQKHGFSPIKNLCGHQVDRYIVHAGQTVPNYDNGSNQTMVESGYAIEPFVTTGSGVIHEGAPSGIYRLDARRPIRDPLAREILSYIDVEYKSMPWASRWIVKKFGTRALVSLSLLEKAGIVYQYAQLVEQSRSPVAQSENTLLITKEGTYITTEDFKI
jgi:methionyl aminopeptidase